MFHFTIIYLSKSNNKESSIGVCFQISRFKKSLTEMQDGLPLWCSQDSQQLNGDMTKLVFYVIILELKL